MVVINAIGILITGKSGTGKSALALELLSRGHQFISDDLTTLTSNNQYLTASCPTPIKNLLLIHGLGLLDASKNFGNTAVVKTAKLDLIVHLENDSQQQASTEFILGTRVPKIILSTHENLPTILEDLSFEIIRPKKYA